MILLSHPTQSKLISAKYDDSLHLSSLASLFRRRGSILALPGSDVHVYFPHGLNLSEATQD